MGSTTLLVPCRLKYYLRRQLLGNAKMGIKPLVLHCHQKESGDLNSYLTTFILASITQKQLLEKLERELPDFASLLKDPDRFHEQVVLYWNLFALSDLKDDITINKAAQDKRLAQAIPEAPPSRTGGVALLRCNF